MNAGASTSAVPSPMEGSGTAWVLLGAWALSPARPTPIHPRPERRGFSALLVMSGTHSGDYPGIPATGKRYAAIRGATVVELQGGKIHRSSHYWDAATLMKQVGLLP